MNTPKIVIIFIVVGVAIEAAEAKSEPHTPELVIVDTRSDAPSLSVGSGNADTSTSAVFTAPMISPSAGPFRIIQHCG